MQNSNPKLVPLTDDEVKEALAELPGWDGDERGLRKRFIFANFSEAMAFMQRCVDGINERDHHPEWTNLFNRIDVQLDTWDLGRKVSYKDVDLAQFLNEMAAGYERE